MWDKLFLAVTHNYGFWIAFTILAVYGIYRKIQNPEEVELWESALYMGCAFVLCVVGYFALFATSSDLIDTELRSGFAHHSVYEEHWTEKVETTTTDSKGNRSTSVSYVYHPDSWRVEGTHDESVSISEGEFNAYVKTWKNRTFHYVTHMNQSSVGDGNMYDTWSPAGAPPIPMATEHHVVNYVRGSLHTILKQQGMAQKYSNKISTYPSPYDGGLGPIKVDRLVTSPGYKVPKVWKDEMSWDLSLVNGNLGPSNQVNILVYVTDADEGFFSGLREAWTNGKKNDCIVVIGSQTFPKIDWVNVLAWTDNKALEINLRDAIQNLRLEDRAGIVNQINHQVSRGFKRKSMKDFEYLLSDITLPFWGQLLVILVAGAVAFFLEKWIEENEYGSRCSFNRFSTRWR